MKLLNNLSKSTLKYNNHSFYGRFIQRSFADVNTYVKRPKRELLDLKSLKESFKTKNIDNEALNSNQNLKSSENTQEKNNQSLNSEEHDNISEKNIYQKDISLQHSQDMAMIKIISSKTR